MSGKNSIFVSYSHKDADWLERIKQFFAPLFTEALDLWDDTRIAPGAAWQDEINKALDGARIAMLLVSPAFLASPFILEEELKRLLERRAQGMGFFWIPIRASLYTRTPLGNIQAAWDPKRPLLGLSEAEIDNALLEIADKISPLPAPDLSGQAQAAPIVMQVPPAVVDDEAVLRRIDRSLHEDRIVAGLGPSGTGTSLIVVPGARVHDPEGFAERIRQDTARKIMNAAKGRPVLCIDLPWPSFDETGPDAEVGLRWLLHELVNALNRSAGRDVVPEFHETADQAAERAFGLLAKEAEAASPLIISALTDSTPTEAERQVFRRFAELWQKHRGQPGTPRSLCVFLAQFERDAFAENFKPPATVEVLNSLPLIGFQDIRNWVFAEEVKRHFNHNLLLAEAEIAFPSPDETRLPMRTVKTQAAGWLAKARRNA